MLNKSVICLSFIIITSFLVTPALCLDAYQRARQAMEHYSAAQFHWQSNLAELVSTKNQSFTDLAIIQRNLQLSLISLRNERFHYLLQKNPKRLTLDKGVSKLANFRWSDKDSKTLSKQSPSYAKLEKKHGGVGENKQSPSGMARVSYVFQRESGQYSRVQEATG